MKKNLKEQQQPMIPMPVNGVSFTQDGKTDTIPSPVVTANNFAKAQVPTPVAAMAGAFPPNMRAPVSTENEEADEMEDETEEDEDTDVTEVDEAATEQFRNALIALLGENVSSEAIAQLEGIFEAAVNDKVTNQVSGLVAQLDENVQTYLNDVTNGLVEKVDDYLDYVVEEWMQENTVAVEQGIKTQIAENFINGLKNLFENHYIDVPSDKYNALDELYAQNRALEQSLNGTMNENMNLKKELMLNECATVFVSESRDLADTQVSKLQSLMENVTFNSVEEYQQKLYAIKNNYLNSQAQYSRPVPQQINEEMTFSPVKNVENTSVDTYVSAIAKLNKKI